jgi:ABC-type multidrug transport system ATPase subunit
MPPPDPDHWLERYGLGGLDRRLGVELSLGQSKRFGLLLGEVLRPSVLLLDEPYVGLDDSAHALVPQLTDVVSERDGIVFMASHVGPDGLAGWRSLHLDRREPVCEQA